MESGILSCRKCGFKTKILRYYVLHYERHSHLPNLVHPCGVRGCCKEFNTFRSFKVHVSREHAKLQSASVICQEICVCSGSVFRCLVQHCHAICEDLKRLILHLKEHINSRTTVTGPFTNCSNHFKNVSVSTFKSHIFRCQRKCGGRVDSAWYENFTELPCDPDHAIEVSNSMLPEFSLLAEENNVESHNNSIQDDDELQCDVNEHNMFLKQLALFTMELKSKHNVSDVVIQVVIDEYSQLMNNNMTAIEARINILLGDINTKKLSSLQRKLKTKNDTSKTANMKWNGSV
jgi:hypothetical protein